MTKDLRPKTINKFYLQLLSILVFSFLFLVISQINAQSAPEFLVSWRASSYIPADYRGKALPSSGSRVEIGFDLIDKNKIVDLSRYNISWFLGQNFLRSGAGLKKLTVNLTDNRAQTVRITIGNYNNVDLDHVFLLPVAEPEAVISVKTPYETARNQTFLSLKNHLLEARPFFFNITAPSQLQFKWRVNGNLVSGAAENPNFLNLNLASEGAPQLTEVNVSLGVSNLLNDLELAGKSLNFIIK